MQDYADMHISIRIRFQRNQFVRSGTFKIQVLWP